MIKNADIDKNHKEIESEYKLFILKEIENGNKSAH